jgi:hypothetical protein
MIVAGTTSCADGISSKAQSSKLNVFDTNLHNR